MPTLHTGVNLDKESPLLLIRSISVEYEPEFWLWTLRPVQCWWVTWRCCQRCPQRGLEPHHTALQALALSHCLPRPGIKCPGLHVRIWCLLAHSLRTNSWSIAEGQTGTSDKKLAFQELVKFNIAGVALDRFPASLPEASGLVKLD